MINLSFTSLYFPIFLLVVILLYYVFPKKYRYLVLLLASLVFYIVMSWKSVFFIAFTTLSIYGLSLLITRNKNKENQYLLDNKETLTKEDKKAYKAKNKRIRKTFLILGILSNIIALAVMKYLNFFIGNINVVMSWFHSTNRLGLVNIFLPLGISFYTFQAIGYIVDVYWNKFPAEKNILKFSLFLTFFPKVMQGPILRYDDKDLSLYEGHDFKYDNITQGFVRMAWGYFKKLVIADTLMSYLSVVFADVTTMSGFEALATVLIIFVQDYCDFSGYMDIAIGMAMCMGIKLPENFNHPYFAKGIDEYWRRWHMTLGAWFKDYVFIPLSVSKFSLWLGKKSKKLFKNFGKKIPGIFGLIVVWFLTGLWHGASWNYVLWGLYFGIIIIIGIIFEPLVLWIYKKLHINYDCLPLNIWRHIRTLILLAIGKLFFMANSIQDVFFIIGRMFTTYNNSVNPNLSSVPGPVSMVLVLLLSIIVLVVDIIQERHPETSFIDKLNRKPIVLRWGLYIGLVVAIIWFGYYGGGLPVFEFGYVQF